MEIYLKNGRNKETLTKDKVNRTAKPVNRSVIVEIPAGLKAVRVSAPAQKERLDDADAVVCGLREINSFGKLDEVDWTRLSDTLEMPNGLWVRRLNVLRQCTATNGSTPRGR